MKLLQNQRPICPMCGEYLRLTKLEGNFTSMVYWECSCLFQLEDQIETGETDPDMEYHIAGGYND